MTNCSNVNFNEINLNEIDLSCVDLKNIDLESLKNENIKKYVNDIIHLPFITTNINNINNKNILYLSNNIKRDDIISNLADILKDIIVAIKIESSIFEFTIVNGNMNNYLVSILPNIYYAKFDDIIQNINGDPHINNKTLKNNLLSGKINPQLVAFLSPHEIHYDRWKTIIKKNEIKEDKKKNLATTDAYTCTKCKEKKCRMIELQTRSSDEPMTQFITCLNCYHVMKR